MYFHTTLKGRRQTKLREGNVFNRVCLFTRGGSHVTITHDTLDFTIQRPPLAPPTDLYGWQAGS